MSSVEEFYKNADEQFGWRKNDWAMLKNMGHMRKSISSGRSPNLKTLRLIALYFQKYSAQKLIIQSGQTPRLSHNQ